MNSEFNQSLNVLNSYEDTSKYLMQNLHSLLFKQDDVLKRLLGIISLILDEELKKLMLNTFTKTLENSFGELPIHYDMLYTKTLKNFSIILNEDDNNEKLFNVFCTMEFNYLLLVACIKNTLHLDNHTLYSNEIDEWQISKDIYNLNLFKQTLDKFLQQFLVYMDKFNKTIRKKDFNSILPFMDRKLYESCNLNPFINNIEFVLDIIFLSLKYLNSPCNKQMEKDIDCNLGDYTENIKLLFKITEEYILIHYKNYESQINMKFTSFNYFENLLYFSSMFNREVSLVKFHSDDIVYDFHTVYLFFYDFFFFLYNKIKQSFLYKIFDLNYVIKNISNYDLKKFDVHMIPFYIIADFNEGLKDLILNHMISSYTGDNNFEVVNRNYWLKTAIDCHSLSKYYLTLSQSIVDSLKIEKPEEEEVVMNTFNHLVKVFKCYQIKLPKKLLLFKEIYIFNTLALIHDFFCTMKESKSCYNEEFIQNLKETSEAYSKISFILANRILSTMLKDCYKNRIRIFNTNVYTLNYYDIEETPKIKKKSNQNSSNNVESNVEEETFPLNNKENKDMYNLRSTTKENSSRVKSSVSNITKSKSKLKWRASKFDLGSLFNFDENFLSVISKDVKFIKNKINEHVIRIKSKDPLILLKRENNFEVYSDIFSGNLQLSKIFREDFPNRNDLEYLTVLDPEIDNFPSEFMKNYRSTFKHYIIDEEISHFSLLKDLNEFLSL